MADRQQQRCPNPRCPSAPKGGRILFEVGRGGIVYKVEHGRELAVMGPAIKATCPSCGQHWLNPDLIAMDGLAGVVQQAFEAAAERVREGLEDRLQGVE